MWAIIKLNVNVVCNITVINFNSIFNFLPRYATLAVFMCTSKYAMIFEQLFVFQQQHFWSSLHSWLSCLAPPWLLGPIVCAKVKQKRQLLLLPLLAIKILILCTICHRCHLERGALRHVQSVAPPTSRNPMQSPGLERLCWCWCDDPIPTQASSTWAEPVAAAAYLQLPGQ